MLLATFLALCIASVPLAGGRLWALADLRLRHVWTVFAALALQFFIIRVRLGLPGDARPIVHVATYLLAGYFLWANRSISGFWLIGLGGAMNLIAIVANGGTMPASPSALATAGLIHEAPRQFLNSAALGSPNLGFLGDIFAVPGWLPLANVFSLGDVCIALGVGVAVHRLCGSRLLPAAKGEFSELLRHRDFARVWASQVTSNLADFAYSIAVLVSLTQHGEGASTLATLLIAQFGPGAVVGILGAPLVDRWSRKRLMVGADLIRALAVGTLLLDPSPSPVHFYLVAVCIGSLGALFRPSLMASLPNLVPPRLLVAANSAVTASFHIAVMAGPVTGGLLAAHLGASSAFAINAASFCVSAALIVTLRVAQAPCREGQARTALREGIRYSLTTPVVRGIILITGISMLAAAIRSPVEPLFILRAVGGHAQDVGYAEATWGLGMLIGSVAAPAATRRWPRMRLLAGGMGTIGACVLVASMATAMFPVLLLWLVAGVGNAVAVVAYSSLLQQRTPDHLRGRVVAGAEAVLDGAFVCGALIAGILGSTLGPRGCFVLAGVIFIVAATLGQTAFAGEREPSEPESAAGEPARALAA